MIHEYVGYLDPPKYGHWDGISFARFMQEKVIEPLVKNGYTLTSTEDDCLWCFKKGDISLNLEYIHNDGGFCINVDTRVNGNEVFADFVKYTSLIAWKSPR